MVSEDVWNMATILTDLIHKTYGALLIGALAASFLCGMNTLQTVIYFRVYPEDSMRLKVLVATIWVLDIIHTAFLWSDMWFYFITIFGQVLDIDTIQDIGPNTVPGAIVVSDIVILIVHLFYVHRIFRFSHRNYWITTPILILVLCEVVCAIGAVILPYRYRGVLTLLNSGYTWIFSLGYILAAVSDIVIMVVLLVLLRSNRQHSISLNKVIDQLVLYTFETGSLTAFIAIAIMITWLTEQRTDIYLSIFMSFPKTYTTALLGLLNTRHYLRRDQGSQSDKGHHTVTAIRFANSGYPSESTNPPALSMQSSEGSTGMQHQHVNIDEGKSVWVDDEISAEV